MATELLLTRNGKITGRPPRIKLSPRAYVLGVRPSAVLTVDGLWHRIRDDGGWLGASGYNARSAWASAANAVRAMERRAKL